MEKTIWKFNLGTEDEQSIRMPKDALILTVQPQNNGVYIWALVDPFAESENRTFLLFGTGHPIKELVRPPEARGEINPLIPKRKYIGTFQINDGRLVFHLFELVIRNEFNPATSEKYIP